MSSFFSFLIQKKIPRREYLETLLQGPLTWFKVFFYVFVSLILLTTYLLIISLNEKILVTVPAHGGEIREGVIGAPRYINPILATTDTDQALSNLVYAGLMRETVTGEIVPELAKEYTISPDGRTYTVTLKDHIVFHDNKELTAEDILFTVQKLQNSSLNSEFSTFWQNISVDSTDTRIVVFNLPQANENFLSHLTFGILPKHIWEKVPPESFSDPAYTNHPIGAGPFKLKDIDQKNGIISEMYFKRNGKYVGTKPYIYRLTIKVYANQFELYNALRAEDIDMTIALKPQTLSLKPLGNNFSVTTIPTHTSIAIYRSTSESLLGNSSFAQIIDSYIDKKAILATVENGYGTPNAIQSTSEAKSLEDTLSSLTNIGYVYTNGTLTHNGAPVGFAMSVENDPPLLLAAQTVASNLGSLGMIVSVKAFDRGTFQDEIDHQRSHIILLRSSPLNIPSSYRPVITLYTEAIPYVLEENVHGNTPEVLTSPSLRYENIEDWYTQTDKIWKWFVKNS